MKKEHKTTSNRLIHEKSPYLLQHADNPVDWYPWGEEAFAKAKKEDKPIFLSIGYSTCHWCHVMEHESFEDPQLAEYLNKYFVAIKVDREERPDIDGIYMNAVQMMTGRGGWPLNIFMTPDQKPFFGGTYFPPQAKWGSPGLMDVLNSIHEAWQNKRAQILLSSDKLTEMIQTSAGEGAGQPLDVSIIAAAYRNFNSSFDPEYGGFGQAPKFPTAHNLSFLLRYWYAQDEPKALSMVLLTLRKMAEGGMYDQLGGGFHRYSTDQQWQIPHFEKMLYDEATLARVYLEGYQITHDAFYSRIVREIFTYVLRDMQDAQGGFYSAEDADSLEPSETKEEGRRTKDVKKEGAFYVWTYRELKDHLSPEEFEAFSYTYDILPDGNAHSDPQEEFIGKNIIYVNHSLEETAAKLAKPIEKVNALLNSAREKLFKARERRPRPHLDDKVLTDWNGLMIASLAFGGRVLDEPAYIKEAERAADFIRKNLIDKDGRLLHRYRDGEAAIKGSLEDYAFFVHGLIELYEATFKIEYLELAFKLSDQMLALFADPEAGGFYFTGQDAEQLIVRQKEIYDGAIPSGNSLAALDLVRLYNISFDAKWEKQYTKLFTAFAQQVSQNPNAYTQLLMAYQFALGPSQEIVVAGKKGDASVKSMTDLVFHEYIPQRILLGRMTEDLPALLKLSSFLEAQEPVGGKTTAFICESHRCKMPVNELEQFKESIQHITKKTENLNANER